MLTPWYFLAILLSLWYMFRFFGFELIFLAILIDGYFGAFYEVPVVSIVTIILVFLIDSFKSLLLMYTDNNEAVSKKT